MNNCDRPATREKLHSEGRSEGKMSGIDTERSKAGSCGIFENEWMYGYMTYWSIVLVLCAVEQLHLWVGNEVTY